VEKNNFNPLTKQEATSIRSRYEARLSSLRREWRSLIKEKPAGWLEEQKAKKKRARVATRRDKVCVLISPRIDVIDISQLWLELLDHRLICVKNLKGRNGEIDLGWEAMLDMVDNLGMGG